MSIETAFRVPLDRVNEIPSQRTIKINDRDKAEDDALMNDDRTQPKPPSLHPESNAQIPPTPTIPTLNLPIPLVSLSSHTHAPSKSSKIISKNKHLLPHSTGGIEEVVADIDKSIPNSLKDLRSMTGSIYSSTLRPNLLTRNDLLNSLGGSGSGTTIKARNFPQAPGQAAGGSLISLGEQLKNLDRSFVEQYLNQNSSFYHDRDGSNSSSSTDTMTRNGVVIGGGKRGIDEVDVEWCFYCGKEGLRNDMILKEVLMDIVSIREQGSGLVNGGNLNGEGQRSWQWVCKSGCEATEELVRAF